MTPQPENMKMVTVRMPESLKAWVNAKAKVEDRSQNYVIVRLLESLMEQDVAAGSGFTGQDPAA